MSETKIHPTAIIEAGAELGAGVEIGAYSIIGPHVKIGPNSVIGPHVVIKGHTTLGAETEVFQFASVGDKPQDLKFKGEPSTLVLGDKNVIREYVTLQPGTQAGNMTTVIGSQNLFMASSHVGHDCVIGDGNIFANSVALAGHVSFGNRTVVGGLSAFHQFSRIGDFALIGGGSMVARDIPPYCIAQGDRASLRGVNVIGLERGGFSPAEVKMVRKAYRALFSSVGNPKSKLAQLPDELSSNPKIAHLISFVESSSRGICSPNKSLAASQGDQ